MIATLTLNPSLDKTLTLDHLAPEEINRVLAVRFDPGGKGINVSRCIQALGGATRAFGFLGGNTGKRLEGLLSCPSSWEWIEEETRENLLLTVGESGKEWKVNFPGPRIDPAAWTRLKKRIFEFRPRFLVLSGSIPPGLSAGVYRELIEEARPRGIPCLLDSDGPPLVEGVEAAPFLVKINRSEFERLVGPLEGELSLLKAANGLLEKGIETVVVTSGAAPAYWVSRTSNWKAFPPPVRAVSTVGAGDTLLAALVSALDAKRMPFEAFRFAVAAGTAASLVPGTGMLLPEDLEALLPRVRIEELRA